MTRRKKNIILIQVLLLLATIIIFYLTYYTGDKKILEKIDNEVENLEATKENVFFNVEYKGLDLNGNRYVVKSEEAKFDEITPELINMKMMTAIFYFKDGTKLKIEGNSGSYNSLTKDMRFKDEILSTYLDYVLNSDNLDFFNKDNYLEIYGNVNGSSSDGNLVADSLKFDISNQTLKISMFDNNNVKVNLKN